jgi:hypothetical protein
MGIWDKKKPESSATIGGDFETAAARVSVAVDAPADVIAAEGAAVDRLEVRPEWAQAAARLCFLPAARLSHPAYALTDEEAEKITPQIQALLQAVADKYAPALVGRVANQHPELFDAAAALGVLYWQKWRMVTQLRQLEAVERERAAEKTAAAPASLDLPGISLPLRPLQAKDAERGADAPRVI